MTITKSAEQSASCPECQSKFPTEHGMRTHRSMVHGRPNVECSHCGKTYERKPANAERAENHFCTDKCRALWQSENLQGADNPRFIGGQVGRECDNCGKEIYRYPSEFEGRKNIFCNQGCKQEWMGENMVGDSLPWWRGGVERKYGRSWRKQRRAARTRDGHKCMLCGLSDSAHKAVFGQSLHVHHVEPFREYGSQNHKEANKLSNLITVCRRCHTGIEP